MDRTAISYVNYLRNQIYVNGIDATDKSNYSDMTYDITTDVQSIKNYLGIDSTLQSNVFQSYSDLTDYWLIIDDSWFLKDQTVLEVTDIYFSDVSDSTRYDGSMMLFSLNDLIYDYTKQDSSAILHFKFKINHYPDITENLVFSFPLFIKSNMDWISNDLIVQYDINFVSINFFTNHSLLMMLKTYVQTEYVNKLNTKLCLDFLGQNNINFIDYRSMIRSTILENLQKLLGKEQLTIRSDMQKFYFHDSTTMIKMVQEIDANQIIDLFSSIITNYYTNHVDQTIDPYAGFTTDRDLYELVWDKTRVTYEGDEFYDKLNINFLKFVLVRNNIYNQKFTLLQDGTEFQNDYIKFRVKNIIPTQTYDFSFTINSFDVDLTSDHTSNLPLKIDILEYSNNLVWANEIQYSRFINEYYFNGFSLKFKGNKLNIDYGFNSLRLFLSDSLSEENKDIRYTFVYAPQEVISTTIAKIRFEPIYTDVKNTQNLEKLLPLSEDFTSYYDLSARFDPDSSDSQMWIQIPVQYELIYSKDVPIKVVLDCTDTTGNLLPHFQYLIWDSTELNMTISPTITSDSSGKTFMVMFRYKFDRNAIYTDDIIQQLNGLLHARLISDNLDTTDTNYFDEFIDVHFITTRFKLRQSSHTPVQAFSYGEKEVSKFIPPFSTTKIFDVRPRHETSLDITNYKGPCNFKPSQCRLEDMIYDINRVCTIKSVPVTIKLTTKQSFSVTDTKMIGKMGEDGTQVTTQVSSIVGNMKEMNNFAKDTIQKAIIDNFNRWVYDELLNQYMSHVSYDIQVTYRPDYANCHYGIGYKSEQIDSLLGSSGSYNTQTMLKYAFDYLGLDHTSDNMYNVADLETAQYTMSEDHYMSVYSYTSYIGTQQFAYELDMNFATSEIYDVGKLNYFIYEAYVKKYYPDYLPTSHKYSKFGDIGVIDPKGKYNYGDNFRRGFFGNTLTIVDQTCQLYSKMAGEWGSKGMSLVLGEWFCENYQIDFTTQDGSQLSLTPNQAIELYFSDDHDVTETIERIQSTLYSNVSKALSGSIKVKRIYSADLTAMLSNLTDDVFTIHIEPTLLSPLYSNFKITDIKFVYDKATATITELFDKYALTSRRFETNEIIGTGIDFMCKYTNRSFSESPVSIMIYYVDEYNYEKTVSVNVVMRSKLQTFVQSETSYLLKWGVNILKGIWLLSVFDQQNEAVVDAEGALESAVNSVMIGDDFGATRDAKTFQGALFTAKEQYYSIFKQYLPQETLDSFFTSYLDNRVYGRPHFEWTTGVSMFVLPENVEMLEADDANKTIAMDAAEFLCDATYGACNKWDKTGWGEPRFDPMIDYNKVIDVYYNDYHDKRGYDINLILLPDTTYNISLKTYLVFTQTLTAYEKEMPTLSEFLTGIGGGTEYDCMTNLQQFLTLARMYPNYEDLLRGILRDLYISKNFPRYGRVPSAMNPITVNEYLPNQWEADYNQFIETANCYYVEFEKSSKAQFGFVVPFEKILLAVDTTSTGIFDCNFTHFTGTLLRSEFGYLDNMRGSNLIINRLKEKVTVSVQVPSVIPRKYIDVTVKPLF